MRKKRSNEELNIWQPAADMMSALVYILLLIILLLCLLLFLKKSDVENSSAGSGYAENETTETTDVSESNPEQNITIWNVPSDSSGGGSGGGEGSPEPKRQTTPFGEFSDGDKSAVLVRVLDKETTKPIKKSGLQFELYQADVWQTLYDHYPVRKEYTIFETNADGEFYLPEKIVQGSYWLKELTAPEGYDLTEHTDFTIDAYYDWDDAYIVNVWLSPQTNTVTVHTTDENTEKGLSGNTFDLIADEDVATADGTVRYHTGDIASTFTTGDSGYGTSDPVYLGKFHIRQTTSTDGYAFTEEGDSFPVKAKAAGGADNSAIEIPLSQTMVTVSLTDELHPEQKLSSVSFTLSGGGNNRTFQTDDAGQITITGLQKNTDYALTLSRMPDGYYSHTDDTSFTVDPTGRIEGNTTLSVQTTCRMLRVRIQVRDMIFHRPVSGIEPSIAADATIKPSADASRTEVTGLTPGTYTVTAGSRTYTFHAEDTAAWQTWNITIFTVQDTAGLMILGLILITIAFVIVTVRRRRLHQ